MRWRGLEMEIKLGDFIDETPDTDNRTFTGAELYQMSVTKLPTLIEPIIPKQGLWAIAGSSDTGKSMLFRQLAISIATRGTFLDFPINAKYDKVIFIATEDDKESTAYLIQKQGLNIEGLENIRFYFECDQIPEYLDDQLTLEPADLVIIDAFSDVFGQNLNDTALIRNTLNRYRHISIKHDCSIGFLHHTGKRTQKQAPSKDHLLSGQGFEAKMRLVFELRNDLMDSNFRHLCIVKGNYLGKEFKENSYKLSYNPETFLHSDTGERIPFDQLAEQTENGKDVKRKLLKPEEVDKETHLKVLKEVFTKKLKPKLGELNTRLSNKYAHYFSTEFGERRTKIYRDYLINDLGLIEKVGKDRSPQSYYKLTTDDITHDV